MKALSIRQPYASLVVAGIKNIENRTWFSSYRGDLAICAGKKINQEDIDDSRKFCNKLDQKFPNNLPTGVIIGVVNFTGVVCFIDGEPSTDRPTEGENQEIDVTWWDQSQFGWILENPRPARPVSVKGRLGLFEIPDEIIELLP